MSGHDDVVDPDKLVAMPELVRLAAIVPDGFHVRASDGMLWYTADGGRFPGQGNTYEVGASGTHLRDNFAAHKADPDPDEDSAAYVAARALDDLQVYIDEAIHDPWPGTVTPPRAFAQVRGEELHLWYGGPDLSDEPVLSCESIPLANLRP